MYNAFFGISENPFSLSPDPSFLYRSPQHEEALANLIYGVQSRKGFIVLTGEVGTGKTTMLVNIFELMKISNPQWFEDHAAYAEIDAKNAQIPTILVVEDSNFFRNQVKGYMTEAGFKVLEGEDGQVALNVLEEHIEDITMVVTDIEMPNMNGFELTEKIKGDKRFKHLPVIALTTLAADEDVARGKAVGIDEYHIKLDKERLMECVHRYAKSAIGA